MQQMLHTTKIFDKQVIESQIQAQYYGSTIDSK